jgi:hypothetical protein
MSSRDLQRFVDLLRAISFDLTGGFAVAEMVHGEWEPCSGIEFRAACPGRLMPGWQAITVAAYGES